MNGHSPTPREKAVLRSGMACETPKFWGVGGQCGRFPEDAYHPKKKREGKIKVTYSCDFGSCQEATRLLRPSCC